MGTHTLISQEETTQGDPLAMPMYALATVPLINKLKENVNDINQVWYADDASGSRTINSLRLWWDIIGPKFSYFPNLSKTWLLSKVNCLDSATIAFAGTAVNVTSEDRPYLGAALGTKDYMQSFVADKVQGWADELELLSIIAQSQPHAAHAAFTHGMSSKWSYLTRTMPNLGHCLSPLEAVIRTKLIPALTGRPPPNDIERNLLALPARLGGIALANPTVSTDT